MAWAVTVDDDVTTDSFLSVATGGTTIIPACAHPTKILSVWVANKHGASASTLTITRTQTSTGATTRVASASLAAGAQSVLLDGSMIELERGDTMTATAGTAAALDVHVSYHRNIPKAATLPVAVAAPTPTPPATPSKAPAVWGKA
jgi:hypothetical protein